MPSVSQIINVRQRRRRALRSHPGGILALGCSTLLSLVLAAGAIYLAIALASISQGMPDIENLPALLESPSGSVLEPTRLYSRDGEHLLARLRSPAAVDFNYLSVFSADGDTAEISAGDLMPRSLISATLATSDPNFWESWGFSLSGYREDQPTTLAQNLVRDLLLWDEPSGSRRALRERWLAAQITAKYGRQKVLEWYLNSAYYGRDAFGADQASRIYFDKPATELSLGEAALLAGVSEAPALNPIDAPQIALERQQQVIQAMLKQGFIRSDQAERARQEELHLQAAQDWQANVDLAFVDLVIEQLSTQFDRERVLRGGLTITTSLDFDLQEQVACTTQAHLANLSDPATNLSEDCNAARLLQPVSGWQEPAPGNLAAEALVVDPSRGEILALAVNSSINDKLRTGDRHPGGSILTPLIYLTGFTRGMAPASLVWDIPSQEAQAILPNLDGEYHGPLRQRLALANDYLVPANNLYSQLGPESIWRTVQQFGAASATDQEKDGTFSDFLDSRVTLLEASQVFATIANQGVMSGQPLGANPAAPSLTQLRPTAILKVEDAKGNLWLDWSQAESRPVISPQLAYLLTDVLSDEAARWSSLGHPNVLEIGQPAAVKLGRTPAGHGVWTIGYTPELLAGIWVGQEEAALSPLPVNASASLWNAILRYASRGSPAANWEIPAGISRLEVCDPSGLLPTTECPNLVKEVFLDGNPPTQIDDLYQLFQVNRETGRLATVFTPPELVEQRVYMVVPAQAQDWAQAAGLPTPPDEYDIIAPLPDSSQARITSPPMVAYVHGLVILKGTADGEDFDFYRLQVGQGLNPQEWLQIGQDSTQPVNNGKLAEWDTSGLNGLYALQLLVVHKDQSVEKAIIQVTVDNQPPKIRVLYPLEGQSLTPLHNTVTFQTEISDDLEIDQAQFLVDGEIQGTLKEPPFAFPWKSSPGEHTLKVKVTDLAGNTTQIEVPFRVR
ncbi:MAG: transglycosylase domain-containing protein [Anaerolineales bacterium]|jgi:membrane peptidoglycan carboxypeptidase